MRAQITPEQEERIKELWLAGVLSTRTIAQQFDVSETAIRLLAKRRKWPERGTGRTAAEIAQDKASLLPVPIPANVAAAVDALSDIGADIIQSHRKDMAMLRMLVMDHAEQAQHAHRNRDLVEQRLVEYFAAKMALDPLNAAIYEKQLNMALSTLTLGNRSKTLLALIQSYERLADMERKNWKLDEVGDGNKSYEVLLKEIHDKVVNEHADDTRGIASESPGIGQLS